MGRIVDGRSANKRERIVRRAINAGSRWIGENGSTEISIEQERMSGTIHFSVIRFVGGLSKHIVLASGHQLWEKCGRVVAPRRDILILHGDGRKIHGKTRRKVSAVPIICGPREEIIDSQINARNTREIVSAATAERRKRSIRLLIARYRDGRCGWGVIKREGI